MEPEVDAGFLQTPQPAPASEGFRRRDEDTAESAAKESYKIKTQETVCEDETQTMETPGSSTISETARAEERVQPSDASRGDAERACSLGPNSEKGRLQKVLFRARMIVRELLGGLRGRLKKR